MLALSRQTWSWQPGSSHSTLMWIIIFFNNQIIPVRVCFIFQQFKKCEIQTHLFFLSITGSLTEASAVWASQVTNSLFVFPPRVFKCCVAVNFWHLRSGLVPRRNTSNKTNMWLRRLQAHISVVWMIWILAKITITISCCGSKEMYVPECVWIICNTEVVKSFHLHLRGMHTFTYLLLQLSHGSLWMSTRANSLSKKITCMPLISRHLSKLYFFKPYWIHTTGIVKRNKLVLPPLCRDPS